MMKKAIIAVSVLAMMTVLYAMPASAGWKDAVIGQLQGLQPSPGPPLPPPLEPIEPGHKYIAAGESHSLAVTCDGEVYAWGDNGCGECGISWIDASMLTFPLLLEELQELRPDVGAVEVVGGGQYSMALMSDGTVYALGNNREGQLGNGTKDTWYTPKQVHGPYGEGYLTGVKRLAAGDNHSLAVKEDGSLWAWGDNTHGKLGIGAYDEHHTVPYQVHGVDNVGFLTDVVDVAGGDNHSLALKSDGTAYAWGKNYSGQLGIGSDLDEYQIPYQVHGPVGGDELYLTEIKKVAAGANFSLALKNNGTLWAWGEGGRGQLGLHSDNDHTVPYQVHGPGNVGFLTDVVDVAAGDRHSLALKSDGTVWAWGYGGHGQLGINTKDDHTVPYQVHGPVGGDELYLTGIIKVAAGANFSLALKNDGTLWAWGEGGYGQLGLHSDNDHTVPYQVHGLDNVGYLTDVVDVAAGQHHTLALKSDGTVYAWGGNFYGQLGIHSNDDHTVPYQVHGPNDEGYLSGIIQVAAGEYFSLALRDDGTVWAWGRNRFYQLGINTKDDHTVPYQVHGPGDVDYLNGIGPTCDTL